MQELRMFVNGQAMSGGNLHHALMEAEFLGSVKTAPRYRFYAFGGEFPGLRPVTSGGSFVPGELYRLTYEQLRDRLLPAEPPELELSAIELEDGSGSLSMVIRDGLWMRADATEITAVGGWRSYRGTSQEERA